MRWLTLIYPGVFIALGVGLLRLRKPNDPAGNEGITAAAFVLFAAGLIGIVITVWTL
jgi:hypothetical protein